MQNFHIDQDEYDALKKRWDERFCDENYRFVDSVAALEELEGEARMEGQTKLIKRYVEPLSDREINISFKLRTEILELEAARKDASKKLKEASSVIVGMLKYGG